MACCGEAGRPSCAFCDAIRGTLAGMIRFRSEDRTITTPRMMLTIDAIISRNATHIAQEGALDG